MGQLQNKTIMFLGQYRTGLARQDAKWYDRVVRALYRSGRMGEGALANRVQKNLGSEPWNQCMERLSAWGIVEFEPARTGRARTVALTASGQGAVQFNDDPYGDEGAQETAGAAE